MPIFGSTNSTPVFPTSPKMQTTNSSITNASTSLSSQIKSNYNSFGPATRNLSYYSLDNDSLLPWNQNHYFSKLQENSVEEEEEQEEIPDDIFPTHVQASSYNSTSTLFTNENYETEEETPDPLYESKETADIESSFLDQNDAQGVTDGHLQEKRKKKKKNHQLVFKTKLIHSRSSLWNTCFTVKKPTVYFACYRFVCVFVCCLYCRWRRVTLVQKKSTKKPKQSISNLIQWRHLYWTVFCICNAIWFCTVIVITLLACFPQADFNRWPITVNQIMTLVTAFIFLFQSIILFVVGVRLALKLSKENQQQSVMLNLKISNLNASSVLLVIFLNMFIFFLRTIFDTITIIPFDFIPKNFFAMNYLREYWWGSLVIIFLFTVFEIIPLLSLMIFFIAKSTHSKEKKSKHVKKQQLDLERRAKMASTVGRTPPTPIKFQLDSSFEQSDSMGITLQSDIPFSHASQEQHPQQQHSLQYSNAPASVLSGSFGGDQYLHTSDEYLHFGESVGRTTATTTVTGEKKLLHQFPTHSMAESQHFIIESVE